MINRMELQPGRMNEFVRLQEEFVITSPPPGLIGGRLYRELGDRTAILLSRFESAAAQEAVMQSAQLRGHIAQMREMVASSTPELFAEAYTYGDFK